MGNMFGGRDVHANRVEGRDGDRTTDADDDGYGYVSYDGYGSGFSGSSRSSKGGAQMANIVGGGENGNEPGHANRVERSVAGIQMEEHPAYVACLDNPRSCNELFLSNKRLEGSIPASIGLLTNLKVL